MLSSSPIRTLPHQARPGVEEFARDRRADVSEAEVASLMLLHAISYLVTEQLKGTRQPVSANREAIQILCAAGQTMAGVERRQPVRLSILGRLRRSLYQALPN